MFKKIILKTLVVYFLSINFIQAAESGGMPQLDPEFWFSQIFWLIITFGILYVFLSKLILPKISSNLETRKSQILENIEAAEQQREDGELKIKEYEEIVLKSKNDAKIYFNQSRIKIMKDINLKKEALDKELDAEILKAETEIQSLKNNAPEKINKIATETSAHLLQQLIGAEVNGSSISAIVEDLSKKKMDRYYGN